MSPAQRKRLGRILLNTAGVLVFLYAIFPVYWMVSTGFKTNDQIFTTEFIPFPTSFTLEHFSRVLTEGVANNSIWLYLRNSAIVALGTVLIGSLFALLSATAIARFRFRGRGSFLITLLVVQMLPAEAMLIPLSVMIRRVGLGDQLLGIIVAQVAVTLPFGIWMLRTFVAAVPKTLEEAALDRRRQPDDHLLEGALPARRPRSGGHQHLLLHHRMERPGLRALPDVQLRGLHDAGRAPVLLRAEGRRLGCHHGRLDADDHPGRHLLPSGPAPHGLRPGGRRREGLTDPQVLVRPPHHPRGGRTRPCPPAGRYGPRPGPRARGPYRLPATDHRPFAPTPRKSPIKGDGRG
ncbi:carbohydrate ABC transporter permease [Nonomuraea dietziae]|uniref:carbohydrate ABC transporter permease n=1 Tax=Nonomuraea dietziae TaxID=65515 RepID=UPI003CD07E3F